MDTPEMRVIDEGVGIAVGAALGFLGTADLVAVAQQTARLAALEREIRRLRLDVVDRLIMTLRDEPPTDDTRLRQGFLSNVATLLRRTWRDDGRDTWQGAKR